MSGSPATPRGKTTFNPTTPATSRIAGAGIVQASPHYTTTRRHSLYGVEDRVVIDPGSIIWKVGFSGEGKPRSVFHPGGANGSPLWNLGRAADPVERAEEDRILEIRLQTSLRSVFHDSLLTDPKARKVILVEHPLLPLYIKDTIARLLFENQVPSVSFASSHLLSLLAIGRITGLVLDCGHLESVALPIFAARPLFPQLQTTPLAGSRLTSHLRALLLMFGTYLPPPTSLSAAVNIPAANRSTRVPQDVLTAKVVEEIKTRCCFVGDILKGANETSGRETPSEDFGSEMDAPISDAAHSESDFSHSGFDSVVSSHGDSSEFSIIPSSHTRPMNKSSGESHLQALATMYKRHSTATDLHMRVEPPPSQQTGTGRGTLIIPGWIRERAAEVLFEGGDVDEGSLAETILNALLKVPVDLRKTLASSILVTGGTAMLPGFIPRLHAELLHSIAPPLAQTRETNRHNRPAPPQYDKYASLRPLVPYFAILNNPSPPPPTSDRASANAGKAPAFSPSTLAWVGGSLAGSLKTGGVEVAREKWDENDVNRNDEDSMDVTMESPQRTKSILPDWTRATLPPGAPMVNPSKSAQAA
ncbi:fungal specific actin related protein [Laccaria bicolor S238N-H82]|uniref:Fungal specific actin related protein n=1 Tax=Laccaria bicolor (strain S238N-H82 / ATCC MYA-4686) TaxID=486041 RepID=B0DA90_LACBS|nr:fungal specific actin related protein [Laccaria bicolor S238N-H82]EDR08713.1 fungal specific actin related protein [Laccaria bicolor S238N-H82]|eukprot:XP_001880938.1 fungal specific actin related protein [Laccaria bicolor S238N-H82]